MVIMQNVGKNNDGGNTKDLTPVAGHGGNRIETSAATEKSPSSPVSNFMPEMSGSDEEDVSEVESFILDAEEIEDGEQMMDASKFLLPSEAMEGADLRTVDPETHARLEALLEAAGIGKLSTADGKALTDPEVLRKLTTSVSCALDEAAAALTRMRAEQQGQLTANADSSRSLAEACIDGDVGTVRRMLDEGGSVNETTEEGESLLSLACSAGYYELAQVLLAMKANVEDRGIKGDCTPLMEAASGGYVDIVRLLMSHGADVNAQSSAGNTPLHYAAAGGYEDVVVVLIESGANVEEHNENGHTPLMEAASAGHVGVARILLNAGAGINTHSNEFKESALTLACYKGHLEMVKFLLEAGADQEHKTDEMHTALMEASMDGHVEVARLLLDSGAQVNMPADSFESPLTLAACGGHVDLANLLIERGANLEEVNDEGYTPLMEAAREGHEEMVALLLAHGADINAQTEETQETALTLACCGGFLEVGDFLIKAGADIELGCSTPLMEAAQEGHLDLVKYLLKAGANVHAQTATRDTALTYASENGHTDVAEVLLSAGAELEHESDGGRTPLMKAARSGHYSTVQFLITKGADVNRQTCNNDHTVLSLACAGGHHSVVELLLGHGADPTHKLKDGSTMIIEAAKGGHTQVVTLLLEWPNGMFMAPSPDMCQVTPADTHFNEPRVPVQGLNNIVPPSDPDPNPSLNSAIPSPQEVLASQIRNKLLDAKELASTAHKSIEQILTQSIQKTLGKRTSSRSGSLEDIPRAFKNYNITDGSELPGKLSVDNARSMADLLPYTEANLRATEKLDAIISNMMKDRSLNTGRSREDQILQRQQILDELQKVERELKVHVSAPPRPSETPPAAGMAEEKPLYQLMQGQLEETPLHSEQGGGEGNLQTDTDQLNKMVSAGEFQQLVELLSGDVILPPTPPSSSTDSLAEQKQPSLDEFKVLNTQVDSGNEVPTQPTTEFCQSPDPVPSPQLSTAATSLLQQMQQYMMSHQGSVSQQNQALILTALSRQLQEEVRVQQAGGQQASQPIEQQEALTSQQRQKYILTTQQHQLQLKQQQLDLAETLINEKQLQLQQQYGVGLPQGVPPVIQQQGIPQAKPAPLTNNNLQKKAVNKQPGIVRPQAPQMAGQVVNGNMGVGEQNTPPHSTPMTPNPSPASPQAPLYASLDLDAQTESNHDTALTLACAGGYGELVSLLLSREADIEHRDKKGLTPLILSATAGHGEVVEILLHQRAEIEAQSERTKDTPLSLACSGGRYEVVELLLARGANKEHRNVSDYTPLSLAASGGYVNIIKLLLSHGAEINSRTGSKLGISPLMLAAMNGHTAAVKLLLDMGSDINAQIETNRNTALTLACFQGRHEVVSLLVDRKANIEHRAKTGLTPLMEAASGGYVEVGRVLLDKGADVNAPPVPSSRDTALTIAADKGHYRFVELLLGRGAAVDVKNKKGNSPLWLACNGGHLDVVQLLVQAGADIDSQDNRKVSCLMAAFRKGHVKVVKWMVKHVNQFPSDQECSRYIQTLTDKELQKKCQQCMDIIESAKDHQAAEANKNATILLEQLDMEKKTEEKRKAAAERRREKRKKKRKEKQEREKKDTGSKNSSPEPEILEPDEEEEDSAEPAVMHPPPAPLTATLTTTIGISQRTTTEAKMSVAQVKGKLEVVYTVASVSTTTTLSRAAATSTTAGPRAIKKKAKSKEKDRPPDSMSAGDQGVSGVPVVTGLPTEGGGASPSVGSTNMGTASSDSKKKPGADHISTSTGIGDLDEFGILPARTKISDKEVAKITKTSMGKGKAIIGRSEGIAPSNQEKSLGNSGGSINLASNKGPSSIVSPKRGPRKEEGWKEVIRKAKTCTTKRNSDGWKENVNKSKKVNVPVNAISRVIGRGGSNINAIREVSGAHIEVEKQKGTTDRVITIKGSADSTRQAHALIMALVTDPDKDLVEILPKRKLKLLENNSVHSLTNGGEGRQSTAHNNHSGSSGSQRSPSSGKTSSRTSGLSNSNSASGMSHGIMGPGSAVWGGTPTPASPKRSYSKQAGGSSQTGHAMERSTSSRPHIYVDKKNNSISVTSTTTNMTVTYTMAPSSSKPVVSSGGTPQRNDSKVISKSTGSAKSASAPIKVLQRPSSASGMIQKPAQSGPPPAPAMANNSDIMSVNNLLSMTPTTSVTSNHGHFFPFHNFFGGVDVLGKKEDSLENRMNFASVVTSNIPSPGPSSTLADADTDLALQAKAPGFKPTRSISPQQYHSDMELNRTIGYKGGMSLSTQFGQEMDVSRVGGYRGSVPSPGMSPRSSASTPSGTSPRGRPATPSDSSPGAMPLSSQKDEYSTPNQPMTLPKIGSSLNPNAPDFTVRSVSHHEGRGSMSQFPAGQPYTSNTSSPTPQQLYQMKASLLNQSLFGGGAMVHPPSGFMPNNMGGSVPDMSLLQRLSSPAVPPPPMMPRPYSPHHPPPTPPSAVALAALSRGDGDNPGQPGSPLGPAPTPSEQIKAALEQDRRMQRPIGTERAMRKAPHPMGNNINDYAIWGYQNELEKEWLGGAVVSTSVALISSTVLTNSGMTAGVMSVGSQAPGPPDPSNQHPTSNPRGFMDGGAMERHLEQTLQNPSLMMPPKLLSGAGVNQSFPPPPLYSSGSLAGDALPAMWNASPQMKVTASEQPENLMWSTWNQSQNM